MKRWRIWETLEIKYSEFVTWAAVGNLEEFYEAVLIYPFLWSKEIEIEKATKKMVPVEELFQIYLECREITFNSQHW